VIAAFIGMVMMIVRKADSVKNQMVMNMPFVYVGGKDKLIFAAQYLFCKLHADFMGLLRCGFTRFKSLYQVAPQVRPLVYGVFAGPGKFNVGGFGGTSKGGY